MRIALCHPTYWPEVQRGSERLIHDLGAALAARGHEVTLLTGHGGYPTTEVEDGVRVVRDYRPPTLPGLGVYEHHLPHAPNVWRRLRSDRFDVVHALFPLDAWVAARLRSKWPWGLVASLHGVPTRQYLVARRYRMEMLMEVARVADELTVLSEAAARPCESYLLRTPRVVPPGIDTVRFAADAERSPHPTILCTASLADPRKRGDLLMRAFQRLRRAIPEARLVLLPGRDPVLGRVEVEAGEGVDWLDPGIRPEEVYGEAWVTVLPSVEEAFGLVVTESLAAGTPVVADRSGAAPEIVTDPSTGRLFTPDDEQDLARALEEAIALAGEPGVGGRCRAVAAEFDWSQVVRRYERVYDLAAGASRDSVA